MEILASSTGVFPDLPNFHLLIGQGDFWPRRKGTKVFFFKRRQQQHFSKSNKRAGDEFYSPLFVLTNGGNYVYNGPIVAGDVTAAELSQYCGGIPENQTEQAYSILHDKVRGRELQDEIWFFVGEKANL